MTLSVQITAQFAPNFQKAKGLGLATYSDVDLTQLTLADGVLADQADLEYKSAPGGRTLAASASETLDLSGVLTDALGDIMAAARIKAMKVSADPGNTNDVVIGGAASNAWVGPFGAATHTIAVGPGDVLLLTRRGLTGWPVTPTTGDLLKIANGGAGSSVVYNIHLIGASA